MIMAYAITLKYSNILRYVCFIIIIIIWAVDYNQGKNAWNVWWD